MAQSKIEWTEMTWNPVTGCTKISAGCAHCYAERMARRLAGRHGYPKAPHHFDVTLHPERLDEPLRWRKPRRVFVCSMSDLFHEDVPDEFIRDVFDIMVNASQHTFQVLTKRPRRMSTVLKWLRTSHPPEARPHIWLGVTIEKPEYCYRTVDLRQTPAAVRFISFEPLLGSFADYPGVLDGIDWAIVGGESGPAARPMHPDWARGLRDQCQSAGVPFFFKQHGAWLHESQFNSDLQRRRGLSSVRCEAGNGYQFVRVGKNRAGRLLDGREWNETVVRGRRGT